MAEPGPSWFATFGGDVRGLASDVARMVVIRRQLAESEIRSDIASARRLAIAGGIGAVAVLTGLPVLVVLLAEVLAQHLLLDRIWWLLILGTVPLVGGLLIAWRAWRRFRSDFIGLQETLAEMHEDLEWLREWLGQQRPIGPEETPDDS